MKINKMFSTGRLLIYGVVLVLAMNNFSYGQTNGTKSRGKCEEPPKLGGFQQITGGDWDRSKVPDDYRLNIVIQTAEDRANHQWPLTEGDFIDPGFVFVIERILSDKAKPERCNGILKLKGQLISPTGKFFEFENAGYDSSIRKFTFTTVERYNVKFEGEILFFENVFETQERGFVGADGAVTLRATGKSIGTHTMRFYVNRHSAE
jgi:hypothetical protein